jgi:hypothetical protein
MEYLYSQIDEIYLYVSNPNNLTLIVLIAIMSIIGLGALLGYMGKIVVYRDFKDLGFVFAIVLFPMTVFFALMKFGVQSFDWLRVPFIIFVSVMLIKILVSTFKDNGNIFKAVLAFSTKIPLGILLIIALIEFIGPKRRQNRGYAFAALLFLTPLVVSLIDNKDNMPKILKRFV